ncbi:MAG: RelA/SpoT domain-containing protein, partial [Actinobacteria bacterium]|nr:RelA/SpoT domain-containing protein [Actinomycetota bacterium]
RPKTTESIVAKLCRSTTRLTLMQDIAGARIVVPSLGIQDGVLEQLVTSYPEDGGAGVRIKDTRQDGDELGYRAIHLVADLAGMPAEIQIRTAFQQLWAQTVEDIDRQLGSDLKHGVGPRRLQEWLVELGGALRTFDVEERFDEDELPSLPEEILG